MKIIKPTYNIITDINGNEVLKTIEKIARVCYKSEDKVAPVSYMKMIKGLILSGHEAMLEHYSFSVKFVIDRGISHEIVRHRMASFAQESTRYCNYSKDRFDNQITFIEPCGMSEEQRIEWLCACKQAEAAYFTLLDMGATPQEARAVLPNSLKTEIVMTANLREWRHFFKLRAAGTTGKPHPQMLEVTVPLLEELKRLIPIVFDDIEVLNNE